MEKKDLTVTANNINTKTDGVLRVNIKGLRISHTHTHANGRRRDVNNDTFEASNVDVCINANADIKGALGIMFDSLTIKGTSKVARVNLGDRDPIKGNVEIGCDLHIDDLKITSGHHHHENDDRKRQHHHNICVDAEMVNISGSLTSVSSAFAEFRGEVNKMLKDEANKQIELQKKKEKELAVASSRHSANKFKGLV